ncbi:MAG: hypothetical protein ACK4N5_10895 [Myxococcales bacterium]
MVREAEREKVALTHVLRDEPVHGTARPLMNIVLGGSEEARRAMAQREDVRLR